MTRSSSDSPTEPADATTPETSERFRLLASERRRALLDVVGDVSTPVGLETLAAAVAEGEVGELEPGREALEHVCLTLHHNHLPRLDDAGVLDYDATARRVTSVRSPLFG